MFAWALGGLSTPEKQDRVEEIYQKYKRLMFATAGKFTKNTSDQEDIVQTVLERLVKIFSASGPQKCCISAGYIVSMVRSVSIDLLRKQGREAQHCVKLEDIQIEQALRMDETLDDQILPPESAARLWAIWPQLPVEDRILLEGKYMLDHSDRELASILNCKPSSIRMKLTRARRRALKLLQERNEI